MTDPAPPHETSRKVVATGRHVQLEQIQWRDEQGRPREWESAERPGGTQAVTIIAWLEPSDRLLLVRQYRPPAGRPVIEFPAGLIDEGETPEQALRRELREETGYDAVIDRMLPPSFNSAGLTGESVWIALGRIDEKASINAAAAPTPDDGESIEVLRLSRDELTRLIADVQAGQQRVDGKVACYLFGLGLR